MFWPFTVWINCSSDLKFFVNSWPSASNFKSFSRSQEQFFLTVGENNFGIKIPILKFINYQREANLNGSIMLEFWGQNIFLSFLGKEKIIKHFGILNFQICQSGIQLISFSKYHVPTLHILKRISIFESQAKSVYH